MVSKKDASYAIFLKVLFLNGSVEIQSPIEDSVSKEPKNVQRDKVKGQPNDTLTSKIQYNLKEIDQQLK